MTGVMWNALQTPNFAGALGQGMEFANALQDRKYQREMDERQIQRQDRMDARLERRDAVEDERYQSETRRQEIAERAARLKQVAGVLKQTPAEQRAQRYQTMAPALEQLGWTPEQIQAGGQTLDDASLDAFIGEVEKEEFELYKGLDGVYRVNKRTGEGERTTAMPFEVGGVLMTPTQGGQPAQQPQQQTSAPVDDVFGALVMQESGGRAGVLGPQTQYGRAEGATQMLPSTAKSMADKLGVPWRPELMRGTDEAAKQYQLQLGRAYFEEGLQKYGGDVSKALMYYHGGPDERLWGPKTQRYAQEVLARTGQTQVAGPAMIGGSGGDTLSETPSLPGFTAQRVKPQEQWVDLPGGGQQNTATGEKKGVPTPMSEADAAKQKEADEKRARGRQVQGQRAVAMVDTLRSLRNRTNAATAGFIGGQVRKVEGSPAFDLASDLETIKANLGFDRLDEMRQNSPTGGALGQVAVQELVALQSSVANLNSAQSPAQLRRNIDRVIGHYTRYAKALGYDVAPPKRAGAGDARRMSDAELKKALGL